MISYNPNYTLPETSLTERILLLPLHFHPFREELAELLKYFGIQNTADTVSQLLSLYDLDGSGVIEEAEFVGFLEEVQRSAEKSKQWEEEHRTVALAGTTVAYMPPDHGKIDIEVVLDKPMNDFMRSVSHGSVDKVLKASKNASDSSTIIDYALSNMTLTVEDALSFYRIMLKEAGDKMKVLLRLLPRMASPLDARQLMASTTYNEVKDKLLLQEALEPLYRPLVGLYNGYYQLDLNEELDVQCFERLKMVNEETSAARRRKGLGDISQFGNWSCFRNVVADGKVFTGKERIEDVHAGSKVQFDFVCMKEAGISSSSISDVRFVNVLYALGLVSLTEKPAVLAQIDRMDTEGREASHGLGTSNLLTLRTAEMSAKHLNLCYEQLSHRSSAVEVLKCFDEVPGEEAEKVRSPGRRFGRGDEQERQRDESAERSWQRVVSGEDELIHYSFLKVPHTSRLIFPTHYLRLLPVGLPRPTVHRRRIPPIHEIKGPRRYEARLSSMLPAGGRPS